MMRQKTKQESQNLANPTWSSGHKTEIWNNPLFLGICEYKRKSHFVSSLFTGAWQHIWLKTINSRPIICPVVHC